MNVAIQVENRVELTNILNYLKDLGYGFKNANFTDYSNSYPYNFFVLIHTNKTTVNTFLQKHDCMSYASYAPRVNGIKTKCIFYKSLDAFLTSNHNVDIRGNTRTKNFLNSY